MCGITLVVSGKTGIHSLKKNLFFLAVGYKDGSTGQPMENTAGDAWGNRFSQRDLDWDGFAID